jgi:hypothetical protein
MRIEGSALSEQEPHSLILACDFTVDDIERMWSWIQQQRESLANIGTRNLVVYQSVRESGRILVTTGIRRPRAIRDILRSPKLLEWFDVAGVQDVPPIFGGEMVEKIAMAGQETHKPENAVVLGVISSVSDVTALVARVRAASEQFRRAGVRKVWIYRALDDGQEVLILEELDSEANARKWIDAPDAAAEWMSGAGLGAYPPMFVGRFAHQLAFG